MNILWHGLSCFELNIKTSLGEVVLVTDPYGNETGLRFPRTLSADIVTISHNAVDANNLEAFQNKAFSISTPGEYEIKNVFVYAVHAPLAEKETKDHCLFRIEAEGLHLAHLGALNRVLTDGELEQLSSIDILMIPVGGGRVLTPKLASEVIEQLEPRAVIPMTHAVHGLKEQLGTAEAFCKALGVCQKEISNKFKISRRDLPEEDMKVVVLERA